MSKGDNENFGLPKIPDSEIIKHLRIELGKKNAYIEALEERVKLASVERVEELQRKLRNKTFNMQEDRKEYAKVKELYNKLLQQHDVLKAKYQSLKLKIKE